MKRHVNIPVFIPHLGCPNQCVFCNQRTISGVSEFKPENLRSIIDEALSTLDENTEAEIAFFGGSFTGIDFSLMTSLLEIAYSYVKLGMVKSIRCSTRPDYINEKILDTLKKYGVKVIELGLQSVSDEVLTLTKRGHGFHAEEHACRAIVERGFTLVGQMMIGLPGSTKDSELQTADFIIRAGAAGARIYPTVVFKDTELCHMAQSGKYTPISLDDAVERSALVLDRFVSAGVEVIRIGLHASENLSSPDTYFAGPNHPALGELVLNKFYFNRIYNEASKMKLSPKTVLSVSVSHGALSKAVGQRRCNRLLLKEKLGILDVCFSESDRLVGYEILLTKEDEEKKCT